MVLDLSTTWTPGENPPASKHNTAFRQNLYFLKGSPPPYTATTISAQASDNSINDSAGLFPTWALSSGDVVFIDGFTNGANNGPAIIAPITPSKIILTSGLTLVNEAAGPTVELTFLQQYSTRDSLIMAPSFHHIAEGLNFPLLLAPELRHIFTGSPGQSQFRFLRNVLSAAFANFQSGRLIGSVSDTDDGLYEQLAQIFWQRTGSAMGELQFDTFYEAAPGAQGTHSFVPLKVDENGRVHVHDGTGGAYALTVNGDVRAADYRKGGSPIGKWILDSTTNPPTMRYTGSAQARTWTAASFLVESQTKCTNLHVPMLRGQGWQHQILVKATTTGVICPARFGSPTYSFTLTGLTTISVDQTDNSFNDTAGSFPADLLAAGDQIQCAGFTNEQNNTLHTIVSMTAFKCIVAGPALRTESAGLAIDVTFTAGYTVVVETDPVARDGYYKVIAEVSIPINTTGNLSVFFLKIPGAPLSIFGPDGTPFHTVGKVVGEIEQLHAVARARLSAGDPVMMQLSNLGEDPVTVHGTVVARWLSPGEDVLPTGFTLTLTLGSPTVT